MNEEDSDPEDSIKPSAEEKREARSLVREAIRELRKELRELRQGMKEGRDLSDDIDTCTGEIELLQKELQSIEECGHTIFLKAKDLIAPKKDVSAKKTKIREEMSQLGKEINHLEARLSMPNLTDDERTGMKLSISNKNERLNDLVEESDALKHFNHTRFVEAREESRRNIQLEEKLKQIELRKEELTAEMLEALEQVSEPLIGQLQEKINSLEDERKKLLEPRGDPLLGDENTDSPDPSPENPDAES